MTWEGDAALTKGGAWRSRRAAWQAKYYHLFSLPACWHHVEWPHWLLYNVCMLRSCELACQGASLNFSLCQIREALWHWHAARKRSLYWHCRQWIVVMIPSYIHTAVAATNCGRHNFLSVWQQKHTPVLLQTKSWVLVNNQVLKSRWDYEQCRPALPVEELVTSATSSVCGHVWNSKKRWQITFF